MTAMATGKVICYTNYYSGHIQTIGYIRKNESQRGQTNPADEENVWGNCTEYVKISHAMTRRPV